MTAPTPRPAPDDKLWMLRTYQTMACAGSGRVRPDHAACPGTTFAGNRADRPVPCSCECHQTTKARAARAAARAEKRR